MNHIEAYVKDIDDKVAMALKRFAKHEVLHRNLWGGLTVLDFRRPNEVAYSLRIVFDDERGHRAYISGDIGEAVVYPTCPANLMKMAACFTCRNEDGSISVNTGYFLEKCAALSDRYEWDRDDFIDDFKAECAESLKGKACRLKGIGCPHGNAMASTSIRSAIAPRQNGLSLWQSWKCCPGHTNGSWTTFTKLS